MPGLVPQLVILVESIHKNFNIDYKMFLVNHNNSIIPKELSKFIEKYDNVTLLNIELTNDKFYYKKECFFLLMPEVFNFVVNEYPDLDGYVFLDPDVYVSSALPQIKNGETYVFKAGLLNEQSKMMGYWFESILETSYKEHYDTFFIYTKNQDFARLWLEESINIAKKGISSTNKIVGRSLQHFCEELAIEVLTKRVSILDAFEHNFANAYLGDGIDSNFPIYHYDYFSVLLKMSIPNRFKVLFRIFGSDDEEKQEVNIYLSVEENAIVKQELDEFINWGKYPKNTQAINIINNGLS